MKIRTCFVSNSSTASFCVKNISDEDRSMMDLAIENMRFLDEYNRERPPEYQISQEEYLESIDNTYSFTLPAHTETSVTVGNEISTAGMIIEYGFSVYFRQSFSRSFQWVLLGSHH